LSIFHEDFVWVWPSHDEAHDPADWTMGMGRFDQDRWRQAYERHFAAHELVLNQRELVKIEVSDEGDGGFAVVDIDTRWRHRTTGDGTRWTGRVCKVYSLVAGDWKLTMHTGVLRYPMAALRAVDRWVDVWARAWPAADVEAVAELYAPHAVFFSHPFRPRQGPADYVAWAFDEQQAAECRFGKPLVDGRRAAVDWWAVVTAKDGSSQSLAGTSLLRFDDAGLVVEQRDVWADADGRVELPSWAP
jgi:ketosteroid isomerase-like protein